MRNIFVVILGIASALVLFVIMKYVSIKEYQTAVKELVPDQLIEVTTKEPNPDVKTTEVTEAGEELIPIANDLIGYTVYRTDQYFFKFYGVNKETLVYNLEPLPEQEPDQALFSIKYLEGGELENLETYKNQLVSSENLTTEFTTENGAKWMILRGFVGNNGDEDEEAIFAFTPHKDGTLLVKYSLLYDGNQKHTDNYFTVLESFVFE